MPFSSAPKDTKAKTALQIIAQLIKMRMTQELVPALDESGRPLDDPAFSDEYKKLQERGLKVIGVSVGSLHLPPEIEERSIKEWNANWLVNAQAERDRIQRRTNFVAEDGKRTALLDYANDLSRGLIKARPRTMESALVALLERSRNEIIRDDRLRQRLNVEPSNKEKERSDLTPTLLSLLQRSNKETASYVGTGTSSQSDADSNIETIDQIIERTESNDL